jgi:hypothetical protein
MALNDSWSVDKEVKVFVERSRFVSEVTECTDNCLDYESKPRKLSGWMNSGPRFYTGPSERKQVQCEVCGCAGCVAEY